MSDGPSTGHDDFLSRQLEESETDSDIKAKTQKILEESNKIKSSIPNPDVAKEYEDVRLATIGALKELQFSTSNNLDDFKGELNSQDPNLSQGKILEEELGVIQEEFDDLQQINSGENTLDESEVGGFGSLMLGYIEATNVAILNGGQEELNSQIGWYLTAFGSDQGSRGLTANAAYYGASAVLTTETMGSSVSRLEQIKNSSDNLETKLFQLSKVLYEVGKEAGAPAGLEHAHNAATRNIIKKVIESDSGNFAVGFNNSNGYYTTESITSESSDLEVGTYLCSLNKSGNLNKDTLLSIFSPAELFSLLEKYKNGEFGSENIRGLFDDYIKGFDDNMRGIIRDTIAVSDALQINAIIQGGEGKEDTIETLTSCDLCEKIVEYTTTEEINTALLSTELQQAQPLFIQGLQEKIKILENPANVKNSFVNYYVDAGVPESIITGELSEQLNILISELEGDTCSMNYILKIRVFNDTYLPDYSLSLNQEQARNIITTLIARNRDNNEIAIIDLKYRLNQASGVPIDIIQGYFNLPENQRNQELENILDNITDETLKGILKMQLIEQFDFKEDIENQENRNEEIIQQASNIYDSLWQPSVGYILDRPQDIGMIRDKSVLLEMFGGIHKVELRDKLHLRDINLSFLYDSDIVMAFPGKIEVNEIRLLPDSILNKNEVILHLIKQSIEYNNGNSVKDFLYAYSSASGSDLMGLVQGLHGIMQGLSPQEADKLRNKIPRSILYASNSDILGISLPDFEFEDDSYYLQIAHNLPHQSGINEHRGLEKIEEIDSFLEYKGNSQEIIKILCSKGLLGYTDYAKHQIGRNAIFWKEIIDNGEITDIRYVNAQTRAYEGFQKYLLNSPKFTHWEDKESIEEYITFNSIDDTMRWFDFLKNLEGSPEIKDIISGNPEILFSAQKCLKDETFLNEDFPEEERASIDFLMLITSNSGDYINSQEIIEPLIQAGGELRELHIQNIENYQMVLGDVFEAHDLNEQQIIKILEILEKNGDPNTSILDIVNDSKPLLEILGSEEEVVRLLTNVNDHLENYLDADTDIQIQQLNELGLNSQNSEIYATLFQGGIFQKDILLSESFNYGITKEIPQMLGENDTEYGLRVQEVFISDLNLSSEQEEIIRKILQNERNIEEIIIFNSTPQQYVADAVETNGNISFDSETEMRRAAGIGYRTEGERSGEERFNYQTGSIEPNPDYMSGKSDLEKKSIPSESQNNLSTSNGLTQQETFQKLSSEMNLTTEEQNSLTTEELNAIASDESVHESFISFRSTLAELGLKELWKFRNDIFKSIGSLDFSISDGDYIGENEFNIFLSKTVYATTSDSRLKSIPSNLESTKQIIRVINHQTGGPNDVDAVNTIGDALTVVENGFREKFAPRNAGVISFNVGAFQKALRS